MEEKKFGLLLVLLAVIIAAISGLYVYKLDRDVSRGSNISSGSVSAPVYIEITEENTISSKNTQFLTDKSVNTLEEGKSYIVVGKNGSKHVIESGTILTDDMIITSGEGEYSIYRISDPEKSISTN